MSTPDKQIPVAVSDEEMQLMIVYNQCRIHYQCTIIRRSPAYLGDPISLFGEVDTV